MTLRCFMMKALQYMGTSLIKYMIVTICAIFLVSCSPDGCECEKYRDQMYEAITISSKSFNIEDLEIKCVGKYCCYRQKNSNDWTCILKSDAKIIVNYDGKNETIENTKKYYSGFIGLSIDIYNIQNITTFSKYESTIDSLNNYNRVNAMFFDQYPKSVYFEMKDRNNSLVKEGIVIKN